MYHISPSLRSTRSFCMVSTWLTFHTGSPFGFQVCSHAQPAHTASCQAFHPCNAWVNLVQFLDYSFSSWLWNNHSCTPKYPANSTISSSNCAALLPLPTMEHKFLHYTQHCVFVGPSLDLFGCLRWYSVQVLHEQEEVMRDWNECRSLRKWQAA